MDDIKSKVSTEEWAAREDLACAYRLIAHNGWDDLIFTHLSARVPGTDHHYLINPFGLMFEEITASSLVKVDPEGKIVLETGQAINPAGFIIHSAVHEARDDAHCVMHVHTKEGVGVSAQKNGLLPISQTAHLVLETLSYHNYEGLALTEGEQGRLIADLGDTNVMILRNHGLLSAGGTVGEAYILLYMLQQACEIQIAAQTGGELIHNPPDMSKLVDAQIKAAFSTSAHVSWQALRRKMDRLDPTYKN